MTRLRRPRKVIIVASGRKAKLRIGFARKTSMRTSGGKSRRYTSGTFAPPGPSQAILRFIPSGKTKAAKPKPKRKGKAASKSLKRKTGIVRACRDEPRPDQGMTKRSKRKAVSSDASKVASSNSSKVVQSFSHGRSRTVEVVRGARLPKKRKKDEAERATKPQ